MTQKEIRKFFSERDLEKAFEILETKKSEINGYTKTLQTWINQEFVSSGEISLLVKCENDNEEIVARFCASINVNIPRIKPTDDHKFNLLFEKYVVGIDLEGVWRIFKIHDINENVKKPEEIHEDLSNFMLDIKENYDKEFTSFDQLILSEMGSRYLAICESLSKISPYHFWKPISVSADTLIDWLYQAGYNSVGNNIVSKFTGLTEIEELIYEKHFFNQKIDFAMFSFSFSNDFVQTYYNLRNEVMQVDISDAELNLYHRYFLSVYDYDGSFNFASKLKEVEYLSNLPAKEISSISNALEELGFSYDKENYSFVEIYGNQTKEQFERTFNEENLFIGSLTYKDENQKLVFYRNNIKERNFHILHINNSGVWRFKHFTNFYDAKCCIMSYLKNAVKIHE